MVDGAPNTYILLNTLLLFSIIWLSSNHYYNISVPLRVDLLLKNSYMA